MKKILFCFVFIFVFVVSWQSALAETAEGQFKKGINLEEQKNYKEAIEAYTRAIKLDPKNIDVYLKRGKACFALDPTSCMKTHEDFTTAIEIDSKNADAYYERALINFYMINNEQGRKDMEMAARLGHKGALEWLGLLKEEEEIRYINLADYLSSKKAPIVHFDFNRAVIKPSYCALLDEVGTVLKRRLPQVSIILAGHADIIGTEEYNYGLSLRRAKAVMNYLIKRKEIAPQRFILKAYGKSKPVAPNDTKKGRALNRRVLLTAVEGL
ncbi:MAG: OmpA family protein [Thermodesulfobacteriota bacterium]|nr:OmpA family protein [Thermodesulfobacteriota bacterium]